MTPEEVFIIINIFVYSISFTLIGIGKYMNKNNRKVKK